MRILVVRDNGVLHASLIGQSGFAGTGKSVEEALGTLIRSHAPALGIALEVKVTGQNEHSWSVQEGELDLTPGRTLWKGTEVNLTATEQGVVTGLIQAHGAYVPHRALYDIIRCPGFLAGSGEDGYKTNVRSAIKRIRMKFRSVDPPFSKIETRNRIGYRWVAA